MLVNLGPGSSLARRGLTESGWGSRGGRRRGHDLSRRDGDSVHPPPQAALCSKLEDRDAHATAVALRPARDHDSDGAGPGPGPTHLPSESSAAP